MPSPFNFDPGKVLMGANGGTKPYLSMNGAPGQSSVSTPSAQLTVPAGQNISQPQMQSPDVLGSEAVRSTGTGPYDQAYRQNLATYAGGNFMRPGGSLTFDPTGNLFGNPTGGGNAPVLGTGTGLLDQALGGQPFSYAPPAPQGPATPDATKPVQGWQDWLNQFKQQGNGFALNL